MKSAPVSECFGDSKSRNRGQYIRGGTGDLDLLKVHRVPALQHRDILCFVNQKLFGIVQTYYAALNGLF